MPGISTLHHWTEATELLCRLCVAAPDALDVLTVRPIRLSMVPALPMELEWNVSERTPVEDHMSLAQKKPDRLGKDACG